ncbi:uncharacterized protein MELLADRAFT_77065 [Melampsora larici-populina 98AG31]|uniref:Uncharacterized protein n=1 Tax=Melampsora larici-populina (strain 98AG31 / pathotype 3-4-7) TaxID=747676 RepID=F4RCX5_MELLP|nr:uncharacterized protein MELLADRAFT_77065 [Melampsora larici-populina 98AG31]EGG09801.1 hypothetical protein MELLADRAFT_77065 [Melampsora larici-populina 98AG31]
MNSKASQRPHSLYVSSHFPPSYLRDMTPSSPGLRGRIGERRTLHHETDHTVDEFRSKPTLKLLIGSSQESGPNAARSNFDPTHPRVNSASNLSPFAPNSPSHLPTTLLNQHTSSTSLVSYPDLPSPCFSIRSDRLEKSHHNMHNMRTTHRRSVHPGFDSPAHPAFAAPRPRPRPKGNTPAARPYSSITLGGRPLSSAFGDDTRIVTGFLASALPLSARPPPLPTRPTQTMTIDQLEQRHRLALQRLQEPANAHAARNLGSNNASPLSSQISSSRNTSPPVSAHRTNRREKPRTLIVLDKDQGQIGSETSASNDASKENKKPKRWAFLRFFGTRDVTPHSPPPPGSKASKKDKSTKARQSDGSESHIPVLILSGESGSEEAGRHLDSDSDSDVPLAQLRLRPRLHNKSSMATVCTSSSSVNLQRTPRYTRSQVNMSQFGHAPLSAPSSGSHRLSMLSSGPANHHESMAKNRNSMLVPPVGHGTSAMSLQKQLNRSSAWLTY